MATTKTVTKKETNPVVVTKSTKKVNPREEIKRKLDSIKENFYDVCKALSVVYTEDLWKDWDFKSYEDYTEKELQLSYRVSMLYRQIGEKIKSCGLTKKQLRPFSWTKVKEIIHCFDNGMSKADIEKILNDTKKLKTFDKIKDYVKSVRLKTKVIEETVRLKLKFTNEQWNAIEKHIKEAQEEFNTGDNVSLAIEYIIMVWGNNRDKERESEVSEYIKEKGLDKPVTSKKVKHSPHSNKGKKKNGK